MTNGPISLGGRLPLYEREELTPVQQDLFDWQMREAAPWAEAAGFRARTQAGQLIGPFNPALLSPAISKAFFEFVLAEHEGTSLSKRAREVIILTVGAVWQAPYELYAQILGAEGGRFRSRRDTFGCRRPCGRLRGCPR